MHPLVPKKVLGQAVVGDQESHALRLGQMAQLDSRYGIPSHLARGQEATMTSDDFLLVIDQEGHVESE
jgi:hypothetical protein